MSKVKNLKKKIKSKIEVIKKINEDPKKNADELYDRYINDIVSNNKLSKKIGDLKAKRKKKKEEKGNIFEDMIDIASSFLSSRESKVTTQEGSPALINQGVSKIKKHALKAANITVKDTKNIVKKSVKEVLFVGTNSICGVETEMLSDTMTLKPSEFDFLNVLKVDPTSNLGKLVYEPQSPSLGDVKMNRDLYGTFTTPYTFNSKSGNNLFDMQWESGAQEFDISGLTQGSVVRLDTFISDYYDSIEAPNAEDIIKNAMLLTLQGDDENPIEFDKSMNFLQNICDKLFGICGSPTEGSTLIQTTSSAFNENDEDVQFYFDFNDVEGIDIDGETARYEKVLRFRDCGNFVIPSNPDGFEDFVYLSTKDADNALNNALLNASKDAFEQTDGSIPLENFQISITNSFILNLPKAIVMNALSPKLILPLTIAYKQINSVTLDVKELMRILSKLFNQIIKELFWKFLNEFWKLVKNDLLAFVAALAAKIIKKKFKRYAVILAALIAILKQIIDNGMDNCFDLFNAIINVITKAISSGAGGLSIPGILLSFSDLLPGYSTDRSIMNITERMTASGMDIGPIFGDSNELVDLVKSIVEGNSEEIDNNSYIKAASKLTVIPTAMGPVPLTPGYISVVGKMF